MARKIDWEDRIGRRMKLRDLHVYFSVVQCGSMAKAAAELGVSQPTVSEIISNLEHTFGVRLLDRVPRGVEPTIYGNALLKRGVAAFDELKQSTRDIAFLADPTVGELKIGCAESIAAAVLPAVIEHFGRDYPRVVVHVDDVPSTELARLRDRKHDLLVARVTRSFSDDDLNIDTLFDDQLVVATARSNPLSRRRKISLAELINEQWILSPPNTWAYLRLEEAFRSLGLPMPKASVVSLSVHLRNHLLASGRFLSAFPKSIADRYAQRVLPVDLPNPAWPVVMVTLKNRTLSPIVERFLQCAHAVAGSPKRKPAVSALQK
jgi:DNA-binding transcriptional LysR family regulator